MSTRPALIGFETRLLAELRQVVAERAAAALPAAETHSAIPGPAAPNPAARRQAGRGRPHRRLAITGAVSAAGAASLAVVLTVTLSRSGGQLAGPAAPRFVAATTVAAVLNNAALAAQREPAVPPRPDQFVYVKEYDVYDTSAATRKALADRGDPPVPAHEVDSTESWISVSGSRKGLMMTIARSDNQPARKIPGAEPWCTAQGRLRHFCTPQQYAAYKPWLPSTTAGMLAYLEHAFPRKKYPNPVGRAANMLVYAFGAFGLLNSTDLTPAQQAAMFHALAKVPHLHIVPKVADALGRTGVGICVPSQGGTFTAIFDPRTFRPLGVNSINRAVAFREALVVQPTVVDRVGQRP